VAISKLTFVEVQHIVDHLEKILNYPIIEKNKRTCKKVMELKNMEKKNRPKGDRIGRFRPHLIKK
jgi:hypothetical protein